MYRNTCKTILLFLAMLCTCQYAFCQTSFKLDKKHGHYSLTTSINGIDGVNITLISRFPGIVIGSETFSKLFNESDFVNVDSSNKQINTDSRTLNVEKIVNGKVRFGDLSYTGDIFIINGPGTIEIPVQLLKNETDSTANVIRLNFKKKTLDFVRRDSFDTSKMHSFKTAEDSRIPIFTATMELADTYGHEAAIEGRFIFDISNGTPVFLFRKTAAEFLKANKFTILSSTDKALNPAGKGIFAGFCKIGERTQQGISIGITNRIYYNNILGCVGPAFFGKEDVVLDPENGIILYK